MFDLTLPVREPVFEGETLTSVVRRYAAAMGYESLQRILAQADGIRFPKQLEHLGRGPPLEWLARFLGREPEVLLSTTVSAWSEPFAIIQPSVTMIGRTDAATIDRYFDLAHRRVCPACLSESAAFERLLWSFQPLAVCANHGVPLIGRCPTCRRSLAARRVDLRQCRCGADLAQTATLIVGDDARGLARALNDWMTGARQPPLRLPRPFLFVWLAQLKRATLQTPKYRAQTWLELGLPGSLADELLAWTAAVQLVKRWPTGFESFLDELQEIGRPIEPSTRAGRAFRELQRGAERLERLGHAVPSDALRSYLLERYTQGHVTSKGILFRDVVHRRLPADRPWITQTEAARRLGLRPPSVAALVRRHVLEGRIKPSGPRGRTNGVVRRDSVERYRERLRSAWSVKQVAVRLGVDRPRVLELIRCNLLRDAVRGPQGWLVPADVVDDLSAQLSRLPLVTKARHDLLPFREMLRRLGVRGWNLAKLLSAVLAGTVAAHRSEGSPRITTLCFDPADLDRLKSENPIGHGDVAGYSMSSIATQLVPGRRIGRRSLRNWIAAGLLAARRRRKSWWITTAEADRFRATYCIARDVCSRLGIARSTLDRWEVERRLLPVYGRRTHLGAGTSVFLRADVERLAADRAA